jgi:hypothetical protein
VAKPVAERSARPDGEVGAAAAAATIAAMAAASDAFIYLTFTAFRDCPGSRGPPPLPPPLPFMAGPRDYT